MSATAYLYRIGDGQDTIQDVGGIDRLVFGPGITPGMLSMKELGTALIIQIGPLSAGMSITVNNSAARDADRIDSFVFDDGTVWNAADIDAHVIGPRRPRVAEAMPDA